MALTTITNEDSSTSTATTVAKWLVPSIAALFGVTGYVIQVAHESLLGIGFDQGDSNRYVGNAAEFFRDVASLFFGDFVDPFPLFASTRGLILCGTALLALALCIWPRDRGRYHGRRATALVLIVLVLIAYKFTTMDVPLARISNLVVRTGSVPAGDGPSTAHALFDQGANLATVVSGIASERRRALWSFIVCSRIGPNAVNADPELRARASCNADQPQDLQSLQDEFLAQIIAGSLVAVFAVMLLRLPYSSCQALGILSLVYLLTVPYGYGKLIKSTQFDYGRVYPAETLIRAIEPPPSSDGRADTAKPAKGTALPPPRYFNALLVSRSAVATHLLVVQRGPCAQGARDPSGMEARYSLVKMSSISASQILSVEEIYRDDAITWALLNERPCPRIASAYGSNRPIR